MHHPHHDAVVQLMRRVAAEIVLPRFRNLAADEVEEKAADDMVTIADRLSEEALSAGLVAIDASARVVGEEAVAADATLLDGIDQGRVWIVDPIDGTNNYASGKTPFGIMIALAEDGEVLAGWILDPVADRLCHTVAGGGAFIDDVAVTTRPRTDERPVLGVPTYFLDGTEQADLAARAGDDWTLHPMPRCAAEQYPRLVLGVDDAAIFQRSLPWDHAAGALFLTEAGGVVRQLNGNPYRIGDPRDVMIAAASEAMWERAVGLVREDA